MWTVLLLHVWATAVSGALLSTIVVVQWAGARLRPAPRRRRPDAPAQPVRAAAAREVATDGPAVVRRAA